MAAMIRFAGPRSGDLGMATLLFEFENFPREQEIVGTLLYSIWRNRMGANGLPSAGLGRDR